MKRFSIILLITLFFASFSGCSFEREQTIETTVPEKSTTYNTDVNGELVPAFEGVSEAVLDASLFLCDSNGRMYYNDSSVSTFTGVDVSAFQGDIDWNAVKNDGIDFVMIRCGYRGYGTAGKIGEDDNFRKNVEGAIAAGLKAGVYFFSQAISVEEAAEEADFVLSIIKDYDITYPVAYDWESIDYDTARTDGMTSEQITQCAVAFCDRIKSAGYEPLLYFNCELGYFNYDLTALNGYHFWLAEYSDIPSFYYDYRVWQYTKTGTVQGIDGSVDINISIKDFSGESNVG